MEYLRQELLERLQKLDLEASLLFEEGPAFQCVVVGGSALILKQYADRSTHDIDLLHASRELLPLLEKYDMNTNVSAHLDSFPESWSQRVQPIEELVTRKITYFTPSLEDLVISKLVAHRPQDMLDIADAKVLKKIDWPRLEDLAEEVTEFLLSDRLVQDFRYQYDAYIAEHKEHE